MQTYDHFQDESKTPPGDSTDTPSESEGNTSKYYKLTCRSFLVLNWRLFNVVVPALLSQIVCMAMETIGIAFVGHLNNQEMTAGVGLSSTFVNVTCQSTVTGLNNALTVLVAIAYG